MNLACSCILLAILSISSVAQGQTLAPPSRTVFKCEQAGKVIYSDSPCLGAKKIDVEPTRGLNKSTGRELVGRDVRHEQHREAMAQALRPITGMNVQQLDQSGRRRQLSTEAQRTCRKLDIDIPALEAQEKSTQGAARSDVQHQLFKARQSFRELRCG
jgi:hypothetical protein